MAECHKARKIVVGFDGSQTSQMALEWAVAEAKLRVAVLVVVHTFDYGIAAADPTGTLNLDVFAERARRVLDEAVGHAHAQQVEVQGSLQYGSASEALLEASRDADLLVVGTRGHGGLVGAVLGSVSAACVRHAACPGVVVPLTDRHPARKDDPQEDTGVAG